MIVQRLPAGLASALRLPPVSYRNWNPSGRVSVQVLSPFCTSALGAPAGARYFPLPSLPVAWYNWPPPWITWAAVVPIDATLGLNTSAIPKPNWLVWSILSSAAFFSSAAFAVISWSALTKVPAL